MNNDVNMITSHAPRLTEPRKGSVKPGRVEGQISFHEAVYREINDGQQVKLSAHAEKRLRERNITLVQKDLDRIDEAVRQAAGKGARESLIIYEGLALITSIRKKTIVTALDGVGAHGEPQVFTNIDSAVLVGGR